MTSELFSESQSVALQLASAKCDETKAAPRTSLEIRGGIEAWLSAEGIEPWNPEMCAPLPDGIAFALGGGYWTATVVESINFPNRFAINFCLDLVSFPTKEITKVAQRIVELDAAHGVCRISEFDGEFIVSLCTTVLGDPRNLQMAIGIALNDIRSVAPAVTEHLSTVKGAESLLNY